MRLLLDQGLPRGAADALRNVGIDVVHTDEVALATATDQQILDYARQAARAVVTLDADFHALLALSGAAAPSVVRVRVEGLRAGPAAALIQQLLAACGAELEAGAMVTVDERSLRIRRLPVVR